MLDTITLYRPVGQHELDLIAASGYRRFPPRLPGQPIFYPVLNEAYATKIARDWNAEHNDPPVGYVTRFSVRKRYFANHQVHVVGARSIKSTGFLLQNSTISIGTSSVLSKSQQNIEGETREVAGCLEG